MFRTKTELNQIQVPIESQKLKDYYVVRRPSYRIADPEGTAFNGMYLAPTYSSIYINRMNKCQYFVEFEQFSTIFPVEFVTFNPTTTTDLFLFGLHLLYVFNYQVRLIENICRL